MVTFFTDEALAGNDPLVNAGIEKERSGCERVARKYLLSAACKGPRFDGAAMLYCVSFKDG